ncbi:hypothetical protein [Paraburkholderia sp.]|uniref:hypothetical protein n=1 Tax=Paraburkholderia sp. TaxID=1926495 RepID=UPI0025ED4AD7|nr:hypothetical protein [Paraburkholderia sp.]
MKQTKMPRIRAALRCRTLRSTMVKTMANAHGMMIVMLDVAGNVSRRRERGDRREHGSTANKGGQTENRLECGFHVLGFLTAA